MKLLISAWFLVTVSLLATPWVLLWLLASAVVGGLALLHWLLSPR